MMSALKQVVEPEKSKKYRLALEKLDNKYMSCRGDDFDMDGLYGFARHHLISASMPLFEKTLSINLGRIVLNVILIPVDVFHLYRKRVGCSSISFITDRLDENGDCRYAVKVPSLSESNISFVYSNSSGPLPKNAIRFGGVAIVLKCIAKVASRCCLIGPRKFFRDMGILSEQDWLSLYLEYRMLAYVHHHILSLLGPKRVLFVSGAYFSPLVEVARVLKVTSYEVGHAIVFPNHPIYSICKDVGINTAADVYIDTEDSPLVRESLVPHRRVVKTFERKIMETNIRWAQDTNAIIPDLEDIALAGGLRKMLVIGQGGDLDKKLMVSTELLRQKGFLTSQDVVKFRPHPAFLDVGPVLGVIMSQNKDLNTDLNWSSAVLASYSMAALIALFHRKYILVIDSESAEIFKSLGLGHRVVELKL